MVDVSFKINGCKVDPGNMEDPLESVILNRVQDLILESFGSNRCKEHGACPKVTVKGRDLDNLSMNVSGCCDVFIDQVKQKLK